MDVAHISCQSDSKSTNINDYLQEQILDLLENGMWNMPMDKLHLLYSLNLQNRVTLLLSIICKLNEVDSTNASNFSFSVLSLSVIAVTK